MKPNPPKKHTHQPKSLLRSISIYVMDGNMKKAQIKAKEEISDAEKLRIIQEKKEHEKADDMVIQEIWITLIREGRKRTPITYVEIMAFQEYLKRTCTSTMFTVYLIGRLMQKSIEDAENHETEVFEMSKILGL
jgi:hypothetical protein